MSALPETAQAAVLTAHGEPFELREYPVFAPEPGALVVRIDKATVCGSDLHTWKGELGASYKVRLPLIPGHEMVGSVLAIGAGADRDAVGEPVRVGDRVVWANAPCGHCYECSVERRPTLCASRKVVSLMDCTKPPHFVGAFAELGYVLPNSERLRVRDDVESAWAAAGSCALRTVVGGLVRAGAVDFTDSVVVQGCGPLGLFATAVLATMGPRHLVVVGAPEARLELAREWGATHTVALADHPTAAERLEAVRSITGSGPSVVLEVSGAHGAAAEGIYMPRPNGRVVLVGTLGGDPQAVDMAHITTRDLRVTGSFSGGIDTYYKALRFLGDHQDRFDWDRMLGRRYGLDELTDALRAMESLDEIKPVYDPRAHATRR